MAAITWTGAAKDGNYNNPANWSPAQVPGSADTVTINPTAATAINASNGAAEALTTSKFVTFNINDGSNFTIGSGTAATTFTNAGTVNLNGSYYGDSLTIGAPKVTFSGGGVINLSDYNNNRIEGAVATDTLNNVNNTIRGGGQLGGGTLTLINATGGIIDATGGNALVVNTGSIVVSNSGLLEATLAGGGGLILNGTINNGTTGHVTAAGGNVYLQGAYLQGGTLSSTGTGAAVVDNNGATLDGSTHTVLNTGQFEVYDNNNLSLVGTITNQGTIAMQGSYYGDSITATGSTVTLTGGGTVSMTDYNNNRISGAATTTVLTNVNNTITGGGQLGLGSLVLVNQAAGTINASAATNALVLHLSGVVTNSGRIESTNTGGLIVSNTTINSSTGGSLLANGGNIYLQGADIIGGLLTKSGTGGTVIDNGGATLDGSVHTVTNAGSLVLTDGNELTLLGTLANTGTLSETASYYGSTLYVGPGSGAAGTVTLTGAGQFNTTDYGGNYLQASEAGDTLVNSNNTITMAGHFGGNTDLNVVNNATIDGSLTNALFIQTSGSFANNHLLESTGSGGVTIYQTTINSSAGGTLLTNGGNISLQGADIVGGLLAAGTAGGAFLDNGNSTLDGSTYTVTNAGSLSVLDGYGLTLLGTLNNTGTLSLNASYFGITLYVGPSTGTAGTVTLTGAGQLTSTDYGSNYIEASEAGDTLINSNNTINMAGHLGGGTDLNVVNNATIETSSANDLYINTSGSFANNHLLQATNAAGGLVINTAVNNSGGGTILAAGGNVYLQGGTLIGGTLNSSGGAAFIDNGNGTLDGSSQTVTNLGTIDLVDGNSLYALGTLVNSGTLALQASYFGDSFIVNSPTLTLTGGGVVTMSDYDSNNIYGSTATTVLDNINNTITGGGRLGDSQLSFINEAAGIVNASAAVNALVINGGSVAVVNKGLIESTNSGGLVINNTVTNTGTIATRGGNVFLEGATINGGTLGTSGTGSFIDNNGATLNGSASALTNLGTVVLDDGNSLNLSGSIINKGSIDLQGSYFGDSLIASSNTTLSGGGTLSLSDYGGNNIYGGTAATVLDNVNNTIEGAGRLGDGQMTLINGGIVEATGGNALYVNLASTGTNTTTGQMLGIGSGGLIFQNGTYSNAGTIQADTGSSVVFQSGAVLTNDNAGVLTGGTYGAVSAGGTATATTSITGSAVTTLNANMVLSGVGSEISFGGATIESSLKLIDKGVSLSVLNGRAYSAKVAISNNGTVALGGGTFTASALTDKPTATLTGFGTVAAKLTAQGSIVATGGVLTLAGKTNTIAAAVTGTGTLALNKGVTTLDAGTTLGVSTIALISGATLDLAGAMSFAGVLDISGLGTIAGTSGFTSSGLFEQTGKGLATISAPFTNSGTISTALGGTLAFTGGLSNTGSIIDNGVFTDSAPLTGGSLNIGAGAAATLGAGSSTLSTLTLAKGTLNTSGGTLSVTGDYNNTATGNGNSYIPFAGVTGTINGQGTQMAVVGVNGTTITSVNGTETITIAAGQSANFVIENTGAAGSAALRGALETTVNGGTINGSALTGSGVTAKNFGTIAAGASSGTYTINYSGGTLANEAIHLASDFANVAGITIDIVAAQAGAVPASASLAVPDFHAELLAWLPGLHAHQ